MAGAVGVGLERLQTRSRVRHHRMQPEAGQCKLFAVFVVGPVGLFLP